MLAAGTDQAGPHDAERSAAYRFARAHATDGARTSGARHGPWTTAVLGPTFARTARGRALLARCAGWWPFVEQALDTLGELVDAPRLVQVYRAPLRVERQVPAAAYELHACARLVDVVRRMELDVPTRGLRRADARAWFLSRAFHVEVKSHESRARRRRRGGARAVHALWEAAREQASRETPNLLVLGNVEPAAVHEAVARVDAGGMFGAVAWLDLRRRPRTWNGCVHALPDARCPFSVALIDVLRARFDTS